MLFSLFISPLSFASKDSSVLSMEKYLAKQKYQFLLEQNPTEKKLTFVDQIYENQEKVIMLKMGLQLKSQSSLRQLYDLGFGYSYSDVTTEGLAFSILFYKIPVAEVKIILRQLWHKKTVRLEWIDLLFESKVYADEKKCNPNKWDILFSFKNELNQKSLKELVWTCSSAVEQGVEKKIDENIDTVKSLTDIELKSFWSDMVKTYESIKELIPQILPLVNEMGTMLDKFNPALKLNLICSALGAQLPELAVPGGVLKKIAFLKKKLSTLKPILGTLNRISKLYDKHPNSKILKKATERIGACAL
jgi:hypothetical protein